MATIAQLKKTLYGVNKHIRPLVREVLVAAQGAGIDVVQNGRGIWYLHGKVGDPYNGEHYSGNGVDFMIRDKYDGDFVADYLWKHRARFGLTHMIWRQRIMSTDRRFSPGRWVLMKDRGDTTQNHYDHVHAFFDGDRGGAPGGVTQKPATGGISMADAAKIMTRLDQLQAAVQVMANALAGKADRTNQALDPLNPLGLQASVQTMANALAETADETLQVVTVLAGGDSGGGSPDPVSYDPEPDSCLEVTTRHEDGTVTAGG